MIHRKYPFIGNQAASLMVLCCLLLAALSQSATAQGMSGGEGGERNVPPAPQSHVLDDAELFREHPDALADLEACLLRMEKEYAYPVYLAVYYSVFDGDLQGRSGALHKAWIGESSRGMMIVYQLDPVVSGNNPAIAYFKGSDLDSDMSADAKSRLIAGTEIDAMLTRVSASMKETRQNHIPFLTELVHGVEAEIAQYHQVQPSSWSDKDNLSLMAVFLGTIVVFTLLGILLWKLFASADEKSSKQYYFPEVRVGRRLDAPYGGGWISEKTFVPASSQR